MPIESTCDSCGAKLRVADEHAGKHARCPKCTATYLVPSSQRADSSADKEVWLMLDEHGQHYGPVSRFELDEWFRQGRIAQGYQIRRVDGRWQPAADFFPGLASTPLPGKKGAPTAAESKPEDLSASLPTPDVQTRRLVRPHRGGTVLACGVLGMFCCLPMAIAAIAMGFSDLTQMRTGRMDASGKAMTQVGIALGAIRIIYLLVQIVFNIEF